MAEDKEHFESIKDVLVGQGYFRVYKKGEIIDLDELQYEAFEGGKKIEVLIDRVEINEGQTQRLNESLEIAFKLGSGKASVIGLGGGRIDFDSSFNCTQCGTGFKEPEPLLFSFNSPMGACPVCHGFGRVIGSGMLTC